MNDQKLTLTQILVYLRSLERGKAYLEFRGSVTLEYTLQRKNGVESLCCETIHRDGSATREYFSTEKIEANSRPWWRFW